MKPLLRPAISLFLLLTLVTGIIYPLCITGISQLLFPEQANGSLITEQGQVLGSHLIGQAVSDPRYFWGRPSATSPTPYNATASGGSNLGPLNPALLSAVQNRITALRALEPNDNTQMIPVDLVTTSASGLDPHISPAAAAYQVTRIARLRQVPVATVQALVDQHTENRQWGILGQPRVNVLRLNLALDVQLK